MSKQGGMIEALEAGLASEGELASAGGFSLDRDRAREKLRRFRLGEPHRYVLLVVQVAHLLGATELRFEVDADDLRASFDGAQLSAAQLEDLYGALFAEGGDATVMALRKLAIALDTARSLSTARVAFESVGADGRGARIELSEGGEVVTPIPKGATGGNRLHVRDRWSTGLVQEFFRARRGETEEALALRQGCVHADLPIYLNGDRISHGLRVVGEGATVARTFEHRSGRGVLAFPVLERAEPARLELRIHGVTVHQAQGGRLPAGLVAVVEGSDLRTDLSLERVIADQRLDALLEVVEAQIDGALAAALEAGGGAGDGPPAWLVWRVRERLEKTLAAFSAESSREARRSALHPGLAHLQVWPALGGGRLSTAEILDAELRTGQVRAPHPHEWLPPGFGPLLAPESDTEARSIERCFGTAGRDLTGPFTEAVAIERNRRAWRARPQTPALGHRELLRRELLRGEGLRGELGVSEVVDRPTLLVVVEGCLLAELRGTISVAPGLVAIAEAELGVSDRFDGPRHDHRLAALLLRCAGAYMRVWAQVARDIDEGRISLTERRRECLAEALCDLAHPDFFLHLLRGFGFEREQARTLAKAADWSGVRADTPGLEAWRRLPIMATTAGDLLSVEALAAGTEPLRSVARFEGAVPEEPPAVIAANRHRRQAMQRLTGRQIQRWEEGYARSRRRAAFLERPLERPDLRVVEHGPAHSVVLGVKELGGHFGLAEQGSAKVRLAVSGAPGREGRVLADWTFDLGLPMLAWVSGPLVAPDEDYDDVDPSAVPALQAAVSKLWASMVRDLVDGPTGLSPALVMRGELRRAVGWWLRRAFPDPAMLDGYLGRAAEGGEAEGVAWLLRAQGSNAGLEGALARAAAGIAPTLLRAPIFEGAGGGRLAAQQMIDYRAAHGAVPLCDARMQSCALDIAVVSEGPGVRETLEALFGDDLDDAERLERRMRLLAQVEHLPEDPHEPYAAADLLAVSRVDVEDVEGEIVIPARPCEPGAPARVALRWRGRALQPLELDCPLPLDARLELHKVEFGPQAPGTPPAVGEADAERIRRLSRRRVNTLVRSLVHRWSGLSPGARELACGWLMTFLAARIGGSSGVLPPAAGKVVRSVHSLDFVPLAHGGWASPARLARNARAPSGALRVRRRSVAREGAAAKDDDTPVALIADAAIAAGLAEIFGELVDDREFSRVAEQAALRRKSAPDLAPRPPRDALATVRLRRSGLRGWLWLTRQGASAGVALGEDGKLVTRIHGPGDDTLFGADGAIYGGAVAVTADFRSATLPGRQQRILRRAAADLWCQLGDALGAYGGTPRTFDGFDRLRDRLLSLARAGGVPGQGRTLDDDAQRIFDRLRKLPLLAAPKGAHLPLDWALAERPRALEYLGLWEPLPAEGDDDDDDEVDGADRGAHPGPGTGLPELASLLGVFGARQRSAAVAEAVGPVDAGVSEAAGDAARDEHAMGWAALLEAVREELRAVRGAHQPLLSDAAIERIGVSSEPGGRARPGPVVVPTPEGARVRAEHPVARWVLESWQADPLALSLMVSMVFTALRVLDPQTARAEAFDFHGLHARYLLGREGGPA